MATVIEIKKGDNAKQFLKEMEHLAEESNKLTSFSDDVDQQLQMLEGLSAQRRKSQNEKENLPLKGNFDAKKYTGKIKSFGDGMAFQKKLRDEWD